MTRVGIGAATVGVALTLVGLAARWPPVVVLGAGLAVLVAGSLAVRGPPAPAGPRSGRRAAPGGEGPAGHAVVHVTNLSRRTWPRSPIEQRLGDTPIRALLPRLRRGEQGLRTYRLPTSRRGVYEHRAGRDPAGRPVRAVPHRAALGFAAAHRRPSPVAGACTRSPTGISRNLEGPSSDASPQGSATFHRLREYVVGDDLRTVHWPSTARVGQAGGAPQRGHGPGLHGRPRRPATQTATRRRRSRRRST